MSKLIPKLIFNCAFCMLLIACKGQASEKDEAMLIYNKDSVRLLADTLPEFTNDPHAKTSQGNQISGVVRTMHQDRFNNLWFGTQNGLAQYDGEHLYYYDIRTEHDRTVTIKDIAEAKEGKLWIGSSDGLIEFDGSNFYLYTEENGLFKNDIWSVAIDSGGLIWIGTVDGACTFDGERFELFDLPLGEIDSNMGISSEAMVHQISVDASGNIWFATNAGLHVYDGDKLKTYNQDNGLSSNFVKAIYHISDSIKYVHMQRSGIYELKQGTFRRSDIEGNTMFVRSDTSIWTFTGGEGMREYNDQLSELYIGEEPFKDHLSFEIYEDRMGRIWSVGLYGAYRLENGSFINVNREGPW